jgi:hypothetical protein
MKNNMKEFKRKYEGGLDLIWDLNNIVGKGVGAEVGVYRGDLSKEILRLWDNGTMFLIDIWRKVGEEYTDVCNDDEQLGYMMEVCEVIKGNEDRANLIRATSETASTLFQNESLDFVYIDANHSYEHVKKDLELWFPKVKKGGIFAGHDYINIDWYGDNNFLPNKRDKHMYNIHGGKMYYSGVFGVNPAVDEFCEKYGYELDVTTEIWGTWWITK